MSKYNSIDIFKFIASFFVVIIHISLFNDVNPYLNLFTVHGVSRLAVPMFFLSSAFFFYKKFLSLDEALQKQALINYTKRMLLLYFCWFIICLPKTIYERFIYNGKPFFENFLMFIKSFFLTSTFSGSWFLVSCVFSAWFVFFISNLEFKKPRKAESILIVVSVVCYLFCIITSAYGNVFFKIGIGNLYENLVFYFTKPYTSILVGIPYFALGRYIAKKDPHLTSVDKVLCAVSLALFFVEIFITHKLQLQRSSDCYLMLLPCSYLLFVLIKDIKIDLNFNPVLLRNTSTIVFFSHFIWIFIIDICEKIFVLSVNTIFRFLIVSVLCLLTAGIFVKLSKYKIFSWLKFFY